MASKIVVTGATSGRFKDVLQKISSLHAKNSFSLAIIAGDLFSDPEQISSEGQAEIDDLLNGRIEVPLPTYFALGRHSLPPKVVDKLESNNGELCENLYFLGRRTTVKTSEGIRIVALGGAIDPEPTASSSKDNYAPRYNNNDANALRGANSADILITSDWPEKIEKGSTIELSNSDKAKSSQQCVSELCSAIKPRYHFSTSSSFFEREPFFHPPTDSNADGYAITRFISLASYGNATKQKWIYAFSLDPSASPPLVVPPGTTVSPLMFSTKKRALPSQEEGFSRFSKDTRHNQRPNKRARQPPPGPSECFFCLSNPNLATHLVTSIGTDAYLTTAKGPLSTPKTFPQLGFPSHILIIPLAHSPTLASIPDTETRDNTVKEMQRYRSALNQMLQKSQGDPLGSVTWEVSRSGGVHTHWQFLPMPLDLIRRGLVEAGFKVEAENEKYPPFEKLDTFLPDSSVGDSFTVWIWQPSEGDDDDGSDNPNEAQRDVGATETTLTLPLDSSFRFDFQFGRRVLGKLLGLEKRTNWRDCDQSEEEETAEAEKFKESFKSLDFTLDD